MLNEHNFKDEVVKSLVWMRRLIESQGESWSSTLRQAQQAYDAAPSALRVYKCTRSITTRFHVPDGGVVTTRYVVAASTDEALEVFQGYAGPSNLMGLPVVTRTDVEIVPPDVKLNLRSDDNDSDPNEYTAREHIEMSGRGVL